VLWTERALAGAQSAEGRVAVSACAGCHACTGTLERHVGEKLVAAVTAASEDAEQARRERDREGAESAARRLARIEQAVDPLDLQAWLRKLPSLKRRPAAAKRDEDDEDEEDEEEAAAAATDADAQQRRLPLAHLVPRRFLPAPAPVPCRLHCGAEFCTAQCEAEAWKRWHCLLCPGDRKARERRQRRADVASGAEHDHVAGVRVDRAAVQHFLEHSDSSNDAFRVAGMVVAMLLVETDRLLRLAQRQQEEAGGDGGGGGGGQQQQQNGGQGPANGGVKHQAKVKQEEDAKHMVVTAAAGAAAAGAAAAAADAAATAAATTAADGLVLRAALARAALPFRVAHKKPWWEAVGRPEDVEPGREEAEFRANLLELAMDSLKLLSRAWVPDSAELRRLVLQGAGGGGGAVERYATLIGMFELNNLALNTPPPLDAYVALLNGDVLPDKEAKEEGGDGGGASSSAAAAAAAAAAAPTATEAERDAAAQRLAPLLSAMGRSLAGEGVRGTAFYALQSCCNHACAPVARAEARPGGDVAIAAVRDLDAGEELTISYLPLDDEVEEEEDETDQEGSEEMVGDGDGNGDVSMGEDGDGGHAGTMPRLPVVGMTLAERRAALRDYGFECQCERCEAEALAEALEQPSD
jgi:hypothetical protein